MIHITKIIVAAKALARIVEDSNFRSYTRMKQLGNCVGKSNLHCYCTSSTSSRINKEPQQWHKARNDSSCTLLEEAS